MRCLMTGTGFDASDSGILGPSSSGRGSRRSAGQMNGLDAGQQQAWQEQIRSMNQLRQQPNLRPQQMDDELKGNPDAARASERAREIERTMNGGINTAFSLLKPNKAFCRVNTRCSQANQSKYPALFLGKPSGKQDRIGGQSASGHSHC